MHDEHETAALLREMADLLREVIPQPVRRFPRPRVRTGHPGVPVPWNAGDHIQRLSPPRRDPAVCRDLECRPRYRRLLLPRVTRSLR
jgi:hypothetical protein